MSKVKKKSKKVKKSKIITEPAQLKIVTYFEKSDKTFSSDYEKKEIYLDGVLVEEYPDSYHDNESAADGFLNACLLLIGRGVLVTEESKNLND